MMTSIPQPSRHLVIRFLLPMVLIAAVAGLLITASWRSLRPATEVETLPVVVRSIHGATSTSQASPQTVIQAPGWVEADPSIVYAATLTDGIVASILVLEGETVEKGQPLATLVDDDAVLAVAAAKAAVDAAAGNVIAAEATYRASQETLETRIDAVRLQAVTQATLEQLTAEHDGVGAQIAKATALRDELADEFRRKESLVEEGAVAQGPLQRLAHRVHAAESEIRLLIAKEASLNAQVASATAHAAAAQQDLDLLIDLRAAVDVANGRLLQARSAGDGAAVNLLKAELALTRCTIVSPINGVVIERMASPGSMVRTGDTGHGGHIVHLYDPRYLQVRTDIPLSDAAVVGVGQAATIVVDVLPNMVFDGEVTRFLHRADIQKNTVEAKVKIFDPSDLLKPDMLARVKIITGGDGGGSAVGGGSSQRFFVPVAAVDSDDPTFLWVAAALHRGQGEASRRSIELGETQIDGWIEVISGLAAGDRIILSPGDLSEGESITIVEPNGSES
jgi:HlyD family secretion protein